MIRSLFIGLAMSMLATSSAVAAQRQPQVDLAKRAQQIEKLLLQLNEPAQRTSAGQQLLRIGAPAMSPLEDAATRADLNNEAREETAKLAQQLGQRIDAEARDLLGRKIPAINEVKSGRFSAIISDDIETLFPSDRFFLMRFAQFPVAHEVPEPFKSNNIFVLTGDGSAADLTDPSKLQRFFQDKAKIDTSAKARTAIRAWLRFSEDLNNDGFFRFTIPEESISVSQAGAKIVVSGQAVVSNTGSRNSGQITTTLTFEQGQLLRVNEEAKLRQGRRPL